MACSQHPLRMLETPSIHSWSAQELDEQLDAARAEAEMFEARAGRALLQVTAIRGAVADLFEAADCKLLAAQEVLDAGSISPANLMQYLGVAEQRVDEILKVGSLPQ